MFHKLINIIFLVFLSSGYAQADYESASAAYEAGDYETVIELLIPLAKAGDAKAQYNLGIMYQQGLGVEQDHTEALKWTRKAAAQGFAGAQYNLGVMYRDGLGVEQDHTEAVNWYHKAAAQGNAPAQYNLGIMYHYGYGLQKDNVQAYAWAGIAAANGYADAIQNRDFLETRLTLNELEEARQLAREYWEKYVNKTNH